MSKKKKWLIGAGALTLVLVVCLFIAASILAKRFEPYIHQQTIQYLSKRFDSEVELAALHVRIPKISPLRVMMTKGRGVLASVDGEGVSLRHRGRRDVPPMFAMKKFSFAVDVGTLFDVKKGIGLVVLDGMEITIPPKGERPDFDSGKPNDQDEGNAGVTIGEVLVRNAKLVILPQDKTKVPLDFHIHEVRLTSVGNEVAMKYDATLTNAKPPGEIKSTGSFGPWNGPDPDQTPLSGDYIFDKADLGVFNGIAGILHSTGHFQGVLSSITARGQADVPDFRLKMAGNPVRLSTKFEVQVDGTNGDTILKPVVARLGSTDFTTSGAVIKHEKDPRRTIKLNVQMPKGQVRDLLTLAMKGAPFMEGQVYLKTSIDIPPLTTKVREKLLLDGQFDVTQGKFLRSTIQDQLDSLSQRGQGQPGNEQIDEVVSRMKGVFKLENEVITFKSLAFAVPGADVELAGNYDMDHDGLDFFGMLRLQARVSQTMKGWKRWVLKPIDPLFAKGGAGTLLHVKVDGSARAPKFGLDRKWKDHGKEP